MNFCLKVILPLVLAFCFYFSLAQSGRVRDRFSNKSDVAGETPPAPNYSNIQNWASHPSIHDMGDSIPKPLRQEYSYDSTIDVFFIHPTTYLRKLNGQMNADTENEIINDRTDKRPILNQASAFNEYRLFAPRYRQANYSAYLSLFGDADSHALPSAAPTEEDRYYNQG